MDKYEQRIEPVKRQLFAELQDLDTPKPRVLEVGIGTGPNLKWVVG